MNILFLSLSRFNDINARGIYADLMRAFIKRGDDVYIASPTERRFGKGTHLIEFPHCHILKIKTLNIQKTNVLEKGIGTLLLEYQFDKAINKYWGNINFELVLYATPPITFNRVISKIKKRCGCKSYLMLKDIFPQNAVDIHMMKEGGFLHRLFRKKEKTLYEISDRIGCMSPANCNYVINNNPEVDPDKIELCPNAIEPHKIPKLSEDERKSLLKDLSIPSDKTLYIYGGNLGKPQGVDFLLKVAEANEKRTDSFIIIVGSGTEYPRIKKWHETRCPQNTKILAGLPKNEYDKLVRVCDVGMIFLDPRFTIPNFPSRLLSYLENSMPVILATDKSTDIGEIVENEGVGLWCESGDITTFMNNMSRLEDKRTRLIMGHKGRELLLRDFTSDKTVKIILGKQ